MVPSLPNIALFLLIYRSEYLLGFVLGMTYTFGAFLPAAIGLLVCLVSFVTYDFIGPIPR
jgi:hypothetical protein